MKAEEKKVDVKRVFYNKNPRLASLIPWFVYKYLKRVIREDFLNDHLGKYGHLYGLDFIEASMKAFNIDLKVVNEENIPTGGRYLFVANHPLGGFDGLMLLHALKKYYGNNQRFLVNDILMNLENLRELFIPINKHGSQSLDAAKKINEAYASDMQLLTFPAGLVSRRINGQIVDLEWKKNFVQKAIEFKRDVVPVYITGRNTSFFYNLSNFRKKIGIKANIEMLYLVDETYKHHNKHIEIRFGEKIPYETFDKSRNHKEWAFWIKQKAYKLNNMEINF